MTDEGPPLSVLEASIRQQNKDTVKELRVSLAELEEEKKLVYLGLASARGKRQEFLQFKLNFIDVGISQYESVIEWMEQPLEVVRVEEI